MAPTPIYIPGLLKKERFNTSTMSDKGDMSGDVSPSGDDTSDDDEILKRLSPERVKDCRPKHAKIAARRHLFPPPGPLWTWVVLVLMKDFAHAAGNAMVKVFGNAVSASAGVAASTAVECVPGLGFVRDGVFM